MKSFYLNRSNILKDILLNKNFKFEKNNKLDFSYDCEDKTESFIGVIPKNITNKLDNKKTLYIESIKYNTHIYQPNTIVDINNIDINDKKIYYLKNIYSSGGNNIFLVKDKKNLNDYNLNNTEHWILQEEVNDLLLYNGKKVTYRIYVVITDNFEFYLYKEALGIVHSKKFDEKSLDKDIKIDHNNCNYIKLSDNKNYEKIIKKIKDICYLTLRPFFLNKNIKNKYIILGIDFLLVFFPFDLFIIS